MYDSLILEVRPRLQSVNAFISLVHEEDTIEIKLLQGTIQLFTGHNTTNISIQDINISLDSLSSLRVTGRFISFRFSTNSQEYSGGFKAELLQNTVDSIESLSNKPLLTKHVIYVIHCSNCGMAVSNAMKFDRILPLPSENADAGDWFCHNHDNRIDSFSLNPKDSDAFYTHCFVHLNVHNISNIRTSGTILVCRYCLQWLGLKQNDVSLRIWFNTVEFRSNNACISTSGLQDVFQSLKNIFKCSISNSLKVLVNCQVSSDQTDTILLWILEKNLQVHLSGPAAMKKYEVAKVLFKFAKGDNDMIVKQWQNDSMVNTIHVSKIMMVDLLKHLHKFNKMFPPDYSESNFFRISYLFLFDQPDQVTE